MLYSVERNRCYTAGMKVLICCTTLYLLQNWYSVRRYTLYIEYVETPGYTVFQPIEPFPAVGLPLAYACSIQDVPIIPDTFSEPPQKLTKDQKF